jgi:cell division transport system permease protein
VTTPESTDPVPESAGRVLETAGPVPESAGRVLETAGPVPESAGRAPETAGPRWEGAAPKEPAWQRRALMAAVAVLAMLIGAGAATSVLLVTGLPGQPTLHFSVIVYLAKDVTAAQKATIEAALPSFEPTGAVKFTSRAQAWRQLQTMMKDRPDLLRDMTEEDAPESYSLDTKGRLFDCTGYARVRHLPGVDKLQVIQHRVNTYVATITCEAEYAKP